jgi:hypothetical protein
MALTDSDIARIAQAVVDATAVVSAETSRIDNETHAQHHAAIAVWIDRNNKRAEVLEKIKAQVGGWSVVIFLGAIGVAVWDWVKRMSHL